MHCNDLRASDRCSEIFICIPSISFYLFDPYLFCKETFTSSLKALQETIKALIDKLLISPTYMFPQASEKQILIKKNEGHNIKVSTLNFQDWFSHVSNHVKIIGQTAKEDFFHQHQSSN